MVLLPEVTLCASLLSFYLLDWSQFTVGKGRWKGDEGDQYENSCRCYYF